MACWPRVSGGGSAANLSAASLSTQVPGVYYTYDFDGFGGATYVADPWRRLWIADAKWVRRLKSVKKQGGALHFGQIRHRATPSVADSLRPRTAPGSGHPRSISRV